MSRPGLRGSDRAPAYPVLRSLVAIGMRNRDLSDVLAGSTCTAAFEVSVLFTLTRQSTVTRNRPDQRVTLRCHTVLGQGIVLVIAAVIALRAPNVRVAYMAPGTGDDENAPVPFAG